jgi:L-histidine Nalpha-methyltransferase / hercynylcysteine S-oxide synthase
MIIYTFTTQFSENDTFIMFTESNLRPIQRWTDSAGQYSLWLLERPPFLFPLLKSPTADSTPFGVPSIQDWDNIWRVWDCVTRNMIPPSMLYQKPIDLRHICLFYFGHIPVFLDIHLSRLLDEPNTEPKEFMVCFVFHSYACVPDELTGTMVA